MHLTGFFAYTVGLICYLAMKSEFNYAVTIAYGVFTLPYLLHLLKGTGNFDKLKIVGPYKTGVRTFRISELSTPEDNSGVEFDA